MKQSVIICREVLLILDRVSCVLQLIHTLDQDVLLYQDTVKENEIIHRVKRRFLFDLRSSNMMYEYLKQLVTISMRLDL